MAEENLTRADLRRMAAEIDSTGVATIESNSGTKDPDDVSVDEREESSPSQEDLETQYKQQKKAKGEPDDDQEDSEDSDADQEDEEEEESSDTSAAKKAAEKKAKDQERFERNWKGLNEKSEALRKKEEDIARREKELANGSNGATIKRIRTVEDVREAKDKDGFSVADYEYASKKFEEDGELEKAATLKQQAQQLFVRTFTDEWTRNTNEMVEEYPDLSDSKKPLTAAVNKCLENIPVLKMIPEGIRYAVRIALGDTSSALMSELKSENRKLKKQLEKLNRRTRLVGAGPSRGDISFEGQDVLSLPKEKRKGYLRELAIQADGGD